MFYLDRNEFNFAPSPAVTQAIKEFDPNTFCFYTRIYDEGKKSIFSVYLSEMYHVPEKQIVLGYGAEDLLKEAVHYFLMLPGDKEPKMLIPRFSWWYYSSIAQEVDGITLQYPVKENEHAFDYDLDAMREMVEREKPRLLLIATPNNPTGNSLTPKQIEEILDFIPRETILLVDEAYASFVHSDNDYISRLVEKHENIIIFRTLSKFYGLPGLRLGFAFIGKGEKMEKFARYANKYLGYDRLSEVVGIAALKSEEYYRSVANVMQEGRAMYEREIGPLPGFKVYESHANFILIRYPRELKEALQTAIGDTDSKVKFMNEPGIDTHMRITLGPKAQNRAIADAILTVARQND